MELRRCAVASVRRQLMAVFNPRRPATAPRPPAADAVSCRRSARQLPCGCAPGALRSLLPTGSNAGMSSQKATASGLR